MGWTWRGDTRSARLVRARHPTEGQSRRQPDGRALAGI
jgi:hypothetical protein